MFQKKRKVKQIAAMRIVRCVAADRSVKTMTRLTKRVGENITYNQERKIECSVYCDGCSQSTANCKTIREMIKKLADYEDAEEQGLLFKLPCKIGDIAYSITRNFISEYTICSIEKYKEGFFFNWRCEKGIYINARGFTNYDIGKTVFLTREAAEQALKKMESEG